MLQFSSLCVIAILSVVTQAVPVQFERRIDQTISDSTKLWQQACITAGGTQDQCSNVAVTAFTSLLEAGGVCDQQNSGDAMINLAKRFGNDPEMIRLAQLFVQQPRNSPDKTQVPYCQVAPANAELNGLFHCQFSGSNFAAFSGDQTGNVPLGLTSLSPAGSCPALPDGPVPDGVQLNTLVQDPIAAASTTATTAPPAVAGNATAAIVAQPSTNSTANSTVQAPPAVGNSCSISA